MPLVTVNVTLPVLAPQVGLVVVTLAAMAADWVTVAVAVAVAVGVAVAVAVGVGVAPSIKVSDMMLWTGSLPVVALNVGNVLVAVTGK